jgi:hypothetical protein
VPKKQTALLSDFETKRDRIAREAMNKDVTNISGVPSWMLSVLTHMMELSGKTHLEEVWPNLEVFFHGGVAFTPYRRQYEQLITSPRMHYMETYNASEGFFGLQDDPADKSMLLMIDYDVFYEFIPMESSTPSPTSPTSPTSPSITPKPSLKVSGLGVTWNHLRESGRNQKMQILPNASGANGPKDEQNEFSQEDLELQWMSMCNRMPQKYSGIATRMKNMNPVILQIPNVEVVVPNEIARDEMEQIKGSIVNTLKLYLHNSHITLSMRVAEQSEREVILTRRQQFDLMSSKNPAIERLRREFDLELA